MKTILVIIGLIMPLCVHSATLPRGADRLRELVVFPEMDLSFSWKIDCQNNEWVICQNIDLPDAITRQRQELKRHADDAASLMRLGYLLNSNDETNESLVDYLKAEQLCRDKVAVRPADGFAWVTLGVALNALDKNDEAENCFRKATLLSSNEWRCWVNLGNFLEGSAYSTMFSEELRDLVPPGQIPSLAVLNYHPSPEILKKSEALCVEAAHCFDHAMVIAPKEPEVFLQRSGFMAMSNLQNCYLRYYRDHAKINPNEWVLAFFPRRTIENLKQVAALKPKDYQIISFTAYLEYWISMMQSTTQSATTQFSLENLPDEVQQSIHGAMVQLENLSHDPDQKIAAGVLENLGALQMLLGNRSEALANFRRAVALDPLREQAWDLLLEMLVGTSSPDVNQIMAVCQARLKANDSARNHLLLSKALVKMKKWPEASEQAEIASRQETNSAIPSLMLAAIALKQSEQTNYLAEAGEDLITANNIAQTMPANTERSQRFRECVLDSAIFSGLIGQPQTARYLINDLLPRFSSEATTDTTAKDILSALY